MQLLPNRSALQPTAASSSTPGSSSGNAVTRSLRPLLPPQAFQTSGQGLLLMAINAAILLLGWAMAARLHLWPRPWLLAWLPLALLMGNSVFVLGLLAHDLMHGARPRARWLRRLLALAAFSVSWMTPTLWQAVHNREHHGQTNGLGDPDRSYLESQPDSWGKRLFLAIAPSAQSHPLLLALGMTSAWPLHHFRTACGVLLTPAGDSRFAPAGFKVSAAERRAIALELLLVVGLHALLIAWIGLRPLPLLLGYFLPLWLGYAMAMAYIYTNHMLSPLSDCNDPLETSLSLRVPAWLDLLHLNFSHHSEHHVFPGLNSSYYPQLRQLLLQHYPERFRLLGFGQAWRLLLSTPRLYRDASSLTSRDGLVATAVPLGRPGLN